jgi:uncharacterized phage protein (TIGR01671 family)
MREIKFRAWTGSKMEYRVVVGQLGAFYVEGIDPKDSACMNPANTKYYKETPIMQNTGLLDKNGREVFEGDVILYGSTCCYTVSWIPEICAFEMTGHNRSIVLNKSNEYTREIVGNIYENPIQE